MSDAISNLGGGGLSAPYLANLATPLNYTTGCLITLFGGPLINKFGIKWSCIIAAVGMPLSGSAYYICAKYRVNRYLIFAKILTGFTYGFLYVAESTAMLSYPLADDRGFYLGVWSAMRNSGSVIGGAINFSNKHSDSKAGGVAWSTYLVFVAFECTGLVWASLLSPTKRARRLDGSEVSVSERGSWKQEFAALWKHLQRRKPCSRLYLPSTPSSVAEPWVPICHCTSQFVHEHYLLFSFVSTQSTNPKRRMITWCYASATFSIIEVVAFGKLPDRTRWSQIKRAWISFACWFLPQAACIIWIGVEYAKFGRGKLENAWTTKRMLLLDPLSLYWILGTFSTDAGSSARSGGLLRAFETAGQTVSYAINSHHGSDARVPLLVPEASAATDIDVEPVTDIPDSKQVT
ncbi:major facilitator superfamily transporter [Fusarium pseudocircinatum]|uniref:Major facilitator superfamily transporter n=1 Tax=Fusarium pseudocircinatum TaxID=56676 RepID=A0A8H5PWB1_9HYPO|nr:major facilitator superfamily transporter [Fusarium pseudocircinatum]